MRHSAGLPHAQRGVALLTILLMVVMATILAASLLARQQRIVRETSVLLRQDQALQYALGGEQFLIALLRADQQVQPDTDSLTELWAKPSPPYPVEDGLVTGRLYDQSGKFNLNNLYHDGQADAEALALLGRLLDQVGLSKDLADAILDWQDPDDTTTGSFGAENSYYQGQNPPYAAANRPFNSLDELRQVRGFEDPEVFDSIRKIVCVLPHFSRINLNTASLPVLLALNDKLDVQAVNDWVAVRDGNNKPINEVGALWAQPAFAPVPANLREGLQRFLAVKSQYYQAQISVVLSGRQRDLSSNVYRDGAQIMVYQRSFAPLPVEASKDAE